MKQTGSKKNKTIITETKPRFTRIGFWFPLLYGIANVFLMVFSIIIYQMGENVSNPELARMILSAFQVCLVFSPSAFILLMFLSRRHRRIFATCPDIYKRGPGFLGMFAVVFEILYLVTLVL